MAFRIMHAGIEVPSLCSPGSIPDIVCRSMLSSPRAVSQPPVPFLEMGYSLLERERVNPCHSIATRYREHEHTWSCLGRAFSLCCQHSSLVTEAQTQGRGVEEGKDDGADPFHAHLIYPRHACSPINGSHQDIANDLLPFALIQARKSHNVVNHSRV